MADAPACPPFPALTEFERRALESMAPLYGQMSETFLEQVASLEAVDRINTIVGFFTKVKVDRAKCSPVPLSNQGAHFEVAGIKNGLGIILWDTGGDGYLETIEGWTVDDNPLEGVDLASLKLVRLTRLG